MNAITLLLQKEYAHKNQIEKAITELWTEPLGYEYLAEQAATELAALTARLAQAERELAFFRNQFPTAAQRWQEAVEKEQQP